ncbi:MAG: FAD:protein FMN transferase [Pseudomonadota bacterium]
MKRRRFIQVVAATMAAGPALAKAGAQTWHGHAMGAEVSLDLYGATQDDLDAAVAEIRAAEAHFSLYDPTSELSRLNAEGGGTLSSPMAELLGLCDVMHRETGGLFDATVQPVFAALARGERPPWEGVGWDRVILNDNELALAPGQALTLNGIAQGFATDRVRATLSARGLTRALVRVGEHAAIGGPFRLGIEDPIHGIVGTRTLTSGCLATSSPGALRLGEHTHILHPRNRPPLWSTVSIEADSAAVADAASTALCLAQLDEVRRITQALHVRTTLVDAAGDVSLIHADKS